jgi:glutathione synthase/RimK-type ligase-like ATP-grasp enzyme
MFSVEGVPEELRVPESQLVDYNTMNLSKKYVTSETLRKYYNKFNIKSKFIEIGFNVPKTYHYLTEKTNLCELTSELDSFVAKPAHMSFGDNVFIFTGKKRPTNLESLNLVIDNSTGRENEPDMLKKCDRGILIEEFVKVQWELKVFVVFGEPVIADLRQGRSELYNIDYILRQNKYLNWDLEWDLICDLAKDLKIDFFRVDFLFDGEKLYATECAFMPSTTLPKNIESYIFKKMSLPYYKYYYPHLF